MSGRVYRTILAAALLAGAALLAANIFLGELNQDEGWYLYAARMLRDGKLPYRDFAFTQGPMMPLVYAVFYFAVDLFGVGGGRAVTAVFGLISALLAAALAGRLAGRESRPAALALGLMLGIVNVYHSYYLAMVKTYALASVFLMAGFLLLHAAVERRNVFFSAMAGVGLAAAAAVRISAAVTFPVVVLFLLLNRDLRGSRLWFWHGLGLAAGCVCFFGPFAAASPRNMWFLMVRYHALREVGGLMPYLFYKAGFVSRLVQAYFPAFAVFAAVVMARMCGFVPAQAERGGRVAAAGWWAIAAVSAVHFFAPFPYEDYQAAIYPLFAAVCAAAAARLMSGLTEKARAGVCWVVLIISTAAALSSPVNQSWVLAERDRIWWRLKDRPELLKLRDVAELIRRNAKAGDELLTQDPYLAVETGMRLPRGLELGQFSYFPELDGQDAARLNVLNREMFERLLRGTQAPVAALSGYAFAMVSPQIKPVPEQERERFFAIVRERYEEFHAEPRFGQAQTRLSLFRLKKD